MRPRRASARVRRVSSPDIKMPEFQSGADPLEISSPRLARSHPGSHDGHGATSIGTAHRSASRADGTDLLKLAFLAGFELSYRISPRLAVGLAPISFAAPTETKTELSDAASRDAFDRPSAGCVPVRVGVRFYPGQPLLPRSARAYAVRPATGSVTRTHFMGAVEGIGDGERARRRSRLRWRVDVASRTVLFVEADSGWPLQRLTGGMFIPTPEASQTEPGTLINSARRPADESIHSLVLSGQPLL